MAVACKWMDSEITFLTFFTALLNMLISKFTMASYLFIADTTGTT